MGRAELLPPGVDAAGDDAAGEPDGDVPGDPDCCWGAALRAEANRVLDPPAPGSFRFAEGTIAAWTP